MAAFREHDGKAGIRYYFGNELLRKSREETMIHHLFIAVRDPQRVAAVSAEFMGGVAVPFPPNALPSSGFGMISAASACVRPIRPDFLAA
jgi:hypothetical protein